MARELDHREEVTESSGNVFADLGLPCSNDDMLKVGIAQAITLTIENKKLTQTEAARLIGTDQAKISNVVRGRLKGFSTDRLIDMLILLGKDVDICISDHPKNRIGRVRVQAA